MTRYHLRGLMNDIVNAERLLELLETKPTIQDKEGAQALELRAGNVSFKDVSFAYDGRQPIMKKVGFEAHSGEKVALVGQTGAGKTTICKLLSRLYDVSGGTIKIDDQDVRDVTIASLRECIGVVPQVRCVIDKNQAQAN